MGSSFKVKTLIIAAAAFTTSLTYADTTNLGTGQLQFTGSITNSACQVNINANGSSTRLDFNEVVPSGTTYTEGDIVNNDTKPIQIQLSNCSGASLDTSKIQTTFDYAPAEQGKPYIENTGGTNNSGLAFEIIGAQGAGVMDGVATAPLYTSQVQGSTGAITGVTLNYTAEMVALNSTPVAGKPVSATVPFTIQTA